MIIGIQQYNDRVTKVLLHAFSRFALKGHAITLTYIPLETAAIFFLANLFPKQGISSEYVTADFICMDLLGLQGAKTENYKMKIFCPYRDSNSRPLILMSSALYMRLSSRIYKR